MGKRYELVCDDESLYCAVGYGARAGLILLVDEDRERDEFVEFLNRTKGKSLRMLVTEYGGGCDLGYDDISDILEDERAKGEEGR